MNRLYTHVELIILALCLSILASCALVDKVLPQSFDSRWGTSMKTLTETRQTAAAATKSGALAPADSQQVLKLTDSARALLDDADKTRKAQPDQARQKLDLADQVLKSTKDFLNQRTKK